ncbi:hypothetical protein V2J09_020648 [Rumex salicifolius]
MASSPVSLPAFQVPPASADSILHSSSYIAFRSPAAVASPFRKPQSLFYRLSHSPLLSKPSDSSFGCCRCRSSDSVSYGDDDDYDRSRDFSLGQFFRSVARKFDDFVKSHSSEVATAVAGKGDARGRDFEMVGTLEEEFGFKDWNWERWEKHFLEVEDQERLISVLKSQLGHAVDKEDYEEAARIKVAIAAIANKDTVGSVISYFKKAIDEERYQDAAVVRDNAGAGLVGWWVGVSDDRKDPYGCVICISAEHGRYVARSYSPRQLATSKGGAPLFEIFLILNESGDYKEQAVYLKRKVSQVSPSAFPKLAMSSSSMNTINPNGGKSDLFDPAAEESDISEDEDDSDVADEMSGFPHVLQNPVPDVQVKVLKVTLPEKVDQDSTSYMSGKLIQDDDKDEDNEAAEDGTVDEGDDKNGGMDLGSGTGLPDRGGQNEFAAKVIVSGLMQKLSSRVSTKDLLRVPAKLDKKGRKTFSLTVEDDDAQATSGSKDQSSKRKPKFKGRRSPHRILFDLEKFVNKGERIPMKVLKDVGDLISFTLRQAQTKQPLSGTTTFNRIELPEFPDPLNGLYVGSHGPFTSEVIQLRHKFGQWNEDSSTSEAGLEFYEYVEAVKITGDPYVPAGQVAFRAKVGKKYQLPHKGIIPEEFGVIARYRGQGRLAEPGFENPRWVDGELVILDGKYIKSGPVVGFVYWAPEYQFLIWLAFNLTDVSYKDGAG